ncbi:MAG: zinc ribbon domain-containing protein [Nitrososphaerales archaeon]
MSEGSSVNPFSEHELSLSDLFAKSFQVARENYLGVLPIFVAFGIVSTLVSSSISFLTPSPNLPSGISGISNAQLLSEVGSVFTYIGYTLGNYFVSSCLLYFAAGIGIWKMNQRMLRKRIPQQNHVLPPALNYASLAITTVISVAIVVAGSLLIFVGALVLAIMLYLVLAAATIEGKSIAGSIARSRQLVSSRWLKTFVLLIGVEIIVLIISNFIGGIAGLPFSGGGSSVVGVVATNFVTALAFPLVSASMLVLYYSNRAKEDFIFQKPSSLYGNMQPEPMGNFGRRFCASCGTQVTQEEKFCHNCGASQSA